MAAGTPDAEALLREIIAWTKASGSTSGQLGQMVLNHGGFVPLLRKRGTLKAATAERVRAFMAAFPTRAALPAVLAAKLKREAQVRAPWTAERHRSLMIRLGYPSHPSLAAPAPPPSPPPPEPAAGGKPRVSAAVIRAARIDGRDLPTFVTALIEMGLECWRDDRIMSGEAVS
ncbi:hypothetical protein DFR49_3377 [Hephaestia caeni]|uniref:Uncharacterized protein n=1 Tax=Hephaestia caeni TaxID=645617 RepID=A0A397NIY6_9SPHN|nr:hypothetical protein [Hephaestia caeni]RIA37492.1 hypothetical protein DFR49_3377 [Hephaestia caeni]